MVRQLVKKHKFTLLLITILLLSFIFRTYQFSERFNYDHDNDLSSWIVKDIVVDKHPRLIGQLTSAPGIFIGPLFYYLLIPFYLLGQMDPLGGVWLIILLGVLTTFSYYFVFSRLFSKEVGLFGAFIQATSVYLIAFDKRVAPSTPTNLWMVWYFYTVVLIARGNYSVFPLLGILIGLVWHIHIALLPALAAVPAALLVAGKIPSIRQIGMMLGALALISLPLVVFELKHNFSQTLSFLDNFTTNHGGGAGLDKLNLNALVMARNILSLIFSPFSLPQIDHRFIIAAAALVIIAAVIKKLIRIKDFIPLLCWILGVVTFFTFSSSLVSEYYFSNIEVIYLAILSLIAAKMFSSRMGKAIILFILAVFLLKTFYFFGSVDVYQKGYVAKKAAAQYIQEDALAKQFPCVAVSYITTPGENVGFRYFFYLNKMHIAQISAQSPVYTIVIPDELAKDDVRARFGHIGIIPPTKVPAKADMEKACSGENTNLTDPLFGFTGQK